MLSQNQVLHQGRYRIINPFGNPDSTGLYEAYDTVSETKVVVRERAGHTTNVTPGQMETLKITFAEQAKRLADMKHDVLLGVRDFFSETGRQYLVMESLDGQDLSEFTGIDNAPRMSDVIKWADQILDALEYLHNRTPAIIHQNINPHNIRLTSEFKIKLLLTGTDGLEDSADPSDSSDGSLNYKALEQLWLGLDYASQKVISNSLDERSEEILRRPADATTDLYGLAATLYHLLTRTAPVDALARTIDILDGNDDPLALPHVANPEIPPALSEFLMKALEIRRENRFSNASEMRHALKAVSSTLGAAPAAKPAAPTASEPEADKLETERRALEAEQKRLEEERLRIERKKQELSEQEQKRAQQAEAKRIEEQKAAAAKLARPVPPPATDKAPQAASSRTAATPLDDMKLELAGDDLLDLPAPAVVPAKPAPVSDVLSLETKSVTKEPTFGSMFEPQEKKGGLFSGPILIVAAVAVLAVAAIGGWMFLGSGSPKQADPSASVTAPAANPSPMPEATPSTPDEPVINETVTVSAQSATKSEADKKAEAAKARKTAADAKPTPEKKKVTVDDLINDN